MLKRGILKDEVGDNDDDNDDDDDDDGDDDDDQQLVSWAIVPKWEIKDK